MKSLVCLNAELKLEDSLQLVPAKGQVLLEVVRCGICGSDLHMQHHCDHMHDLAARVGFNGQNPQISWFSVMSSAVKS